MKRFLYVLLVMIMIASCSKPAQKNVDDTFPEYDINMYCHKRAELYKKDDIDGLISFSDSIFNHCLEEKKVDYEWLKTNWDLLSSKAKTFCKQAAGDPDENYSDLKVCAQVVTCKEDNDNLDICVDQKN